MTFDVSVQDCRLDVAVKTGNEASLRVDFVLLKAGVLLTFDFLVGVCVLHARADRSLPRSVGDAARMVGDLVPVEDGLELWCFCHINVSRVRICFRTHDVFGGQTVKAIDLFFLSLIRVLRVDLLVVELTQLILRG